LMNSKSELKNKKKATKPAHLIPAPYFDGLLGVSMFYRA